MMNFHNIMNIVLTFYRSIIDGRVRQKDDNAIITEISTEETLSVNE